MGCCSRRRKSASGRSRPTGIGWRCRRSICWAPASRDEQLIVPRKGVLELSRLLDGDGEVQLALGANHIRVQLDGIRLTSKLIDGRFPEYSRVVPNQPKNVIKADRNLFRQALQRTAILSNEKYRGVRLELSPNSVVLAGQQSRSRKRPSRRSRSSTAATRWRSASTSITCSTRWPPSIASKSSSASRTPIRAA